MGAEMVVCRWGVLPARAVRSGWVQQGEGEIGRRGWIRVRSGAVRCSGVVLRTCKNCKAQFDPALNHPTACRFHTAHFGDWATEADSRTKVKRRENSKACTRAAR